MFVVLSTANDYQVIGPFEKREDAVNYANEHFFGFRIFPMYSPQQKGNQMFDSVNPEDKVILTEIDRYNKEVCKHLNVTEVGMVGHYGDTTDCGFGCKIVKCDKCGDISESHRSIYGCPLGLHL